MNKLHMVTFLLLVFGGLNWLLIAVLDWDVGDLFGGSDSVISRIIYILVGLAALYEVVTHKNNCKSCQEMKGRMSRENSAAASGWK